MCATIGRPELADDARFTTIGRRLENQQALKDELSATLAARGSDEWLAMLRAAGLPCGPINTIADVVADPQVAARNMIVEVEDPKAGTVKLFGCPIKMSAFADPHVARDRARARRRSGANPEGARGCGRDMTGGQQR